MYQRLRLPCDMVSQMSLGENGYCISYDHPEAGVGLIRLLVELLVVRHLVFGVDHSAEEVSNLEPFLWSFCLAIGAATGSSRLSNRLPREG